MIKGKGGQDGTLSIMMPFHFPIDTPLKDGSALRLAQAEPLGMLNRFAAYTKSLLMMGHPFHMGKCHPMMIFRLIGLVFVVPY